MPGKKKNWEREGEGPSDKKYPYLSDRDNRELIRAEENIRNSRYSFKPFLNKKQIEKIESLALATASGEIKFSAIKGNGNPGIFSPINRDLLPAYQRENRKNYLALLGFIVTVKAWFIKTIVKEPLPLGVYRYRDQDRLEEGLKKSYKNIELELTELKAKANDIPEAKNIKPRKDYNPNIFRDYPLLIQDFEYWRHMEKMRSLFERWFDHYMPEPAVHPEKKRGRKQDDEAKKLKNKLCEEMYKLIEEKVYSIIEAARLVEPKQDHYKISSLCTIYYEWCRERNVMK